MITVIADDSYVEISGHAGMGPAGTDIVCAAVSALANTAGSLAWDEPEAREGYLLIRYRGSDPDELAYIHFLMTGLTLIADQYPDNITITDLRAV